VGETSTQNRQSEKKKSHIMSSSGREIVGMGYSTKPVVSGSTQKDQRGCRQITREAHDIEVGGKARATDLGDTMGRDEQGGVARNDVIWGQKNVVAMMVPGRPYQDPTKKAAEITQGRD
jgi:hypothetical protein